jgi:hypothetical protein
MSRQRDREEFVAIMAQEGLPLHVARQLMRAGATLHRLAELECSSETADSGSSAVSGRQGCVPVSGLRLIRGERERDAWDSAAYCGAGCARGKACARHAQAIRGFRAYLQW